MTRTKEAHGPRTEDAETIRQALHSVFSYSLVLQTGFNHSAFQETIHLQLLPSRKKATHGPGSLVKTTGPIEEIMHYIKKEKSFQ